MIIAGAQGGLMEETPTFRELPYMAGNPRGIHYPQHFICS